MVLLLFLVGQLSEYMQQWPGADEPQHPVGPADYSSGLGLGEGALCTCYDTFLFLLELALPGGVAGDMLLGI